jgi:hypothetical protein
MKELRIFFKSGNLCTSRKLTEMVKLWNNLPVEFLKRLGGMPTA